MVIHRYFNLQTSLKRNKFSQCVLLEFVSYVAGMVNVVFDELWWCGFFFKFWECNINWPYCLFVL